MLLVCDNILQNINIIFNVKHSKTETDLDGLFLVLVNCKQATCYQDMFGNYPRWKNHPRFFWEAGAVKLATEMSPKFTV